MTDVFSIITWKYTLPLPEGFSQGLYNTGKVLASGKYDTHATSLSHHKLSEELQKVFVLTSSIDMVTIFCQFFSQIF